MGFIMEKSGDSRPNSPQPGTSASFGINPQIAQQLLAEQIKNEEKKKKRNEYMRGYRAKKRAQQQTEKQDMEDQKRQAEVTVEKHAERKRVKRISEAKRRAEETPDQYAARLEADRVAHVSQRAEESPDQYAARLEADRVANVSQRAEESPDQYAARLEADRVAHVSQRAEESPDQYAARLEADRVAHVSQRAEESPDQYAARLEADRVAHVSQRAEESPDQYAARLEADRVAHVSQRAEESPDQYAARQEADRLAHEDRRSQETPEQHAERVESYRIARDGHRAEATPEQRQQKLDYEREARKRRRIARRSPYVARRSATEVEEYSLGDMNVECSHCHALHFEKERTTRKKFATCCNSGNVQLPPLYPYPQLLTSWLNGSHSDSKMFLKYVRNYNCMFSFVSFGYNAVKHKGSGPNTFVIQGAVHHLISKYASVEGQKGPTYSQIYFLGPEEAIQARAGNPINEKCSERLIQQIETLLRQVNPYARTYKQMKEVMEETDTVDVTMVLVKDPTYDQRRYNLPQQAEVCAVFTSGEDNEDDFQRQMKIYPKGQHDKLENMDITSHHCDPMSYPLLFPYADAGWHINLKWNGKKVSVLQFYSYRIQIRLEFNPLLHAGRLTQQYCIDAFLKVEGERLNFVKQQQSKLRVESYQGLQDFCKNQAQEKGLKAGRLMILPSSFSGGKRDMQQGYQDAMTMVAVLGKPDLFITFTCNPKWKEIVGALLPHESANDRPDVVVTVFNLKLKELLHDIVENQVLGKVIAYQYVIEFQKRGLPHCHMLFILDDEDKLREPEDVDTVVCAEIPDSTDDPVLYDIVSSLMMHGPCGAMNTKCVCMDVDSDGNKYCTKKFPKSFNPQTIRNPSGYPEYRRREDGRTVTKKDNVLDNCWVTAYNSFLCKKYNAHINVEVCSSIRSVKYIYKYIYKGHDAAVVKINEKDGTGYYNYDEVQAFIDTRYLSAPEAMWRLRQYKMQGRSHTIIRLAVHLPLQQNVVFRDNDTDDDRAELVAALQKAERKPTTLLAYFRLNADPQHPTAKQFLYREIPFHYVVDEKTGLYKPRQRGQEKILTRMYAVSPRDMERYALKMLLLHVKGATSFEDLRKVNGILHESFVAAARALQLLDDDQCWIKTMEDAIVYQVPSQLRKLFVAICEFGFPSDHKALFCKFQEDLCEDYFRQYGDEEVALNMCLKDLEGHFREFSHSCMSFGLPAPKDFETDMDFTVEVEAEKEKAANLTDQFNMEQRQAFDEIMASVDGTSPNKCFFLSGAGGCGKTFIYKALISTIRSRRHRVKAVAPTGLAATLFNRQTVHTGFGLPLLIGSKTASMISANSVHCDLLKQVKLIIWDEISMCTKDMFNAVDRSLRYLLQINRPFGGISIVVGGDFRQQTPVLKHAGRLKIIEACVKKCALWSQFKQLKLTQNMRVNQHEVEFSEWLLKIGSGLTANDGTRSNHVAIPPSIISEDIVKSVFGDDITSLSTDELASRAILCPLNEDTLRINEAILRKLPGEVTTFYSSDKVEGCEDAQEEELNPIEFLNSLTPSGLPPHKLNLKKGCCVMLQRNMSPKQGLCNGTRLIVESMSANVIHCSIFTGEHKGTRVLIPRLPLTSSDNDVPFKLRRMQFPLRLAYSITITKSQGQTFDKIGVFLPKPVFAHGQLYTALSRVKSQSGLFVQILPGSTQGKIYENDENVYAFNSVYDELL